MISIFVSDSTDKRMIYASDYLRDMGYNITKNSDNADYILPTVTANPSSTNLPYMKCEPFLIANAFLTAESAICVAKDNSELSLLASSILIIGYGRIAKALLDVCRAYTTNITICARSSADREFAKMYGANAIDFDALKYNGDYNFVFNTVPHPVLNDAELIALPSDCLVIDLASFPGGVDKHMAYARGIKLVEARGLPGKYSPKSAGKIIADTVDKLIKEGKV